jgi:hypothetical protein
MASAVTQSSFMGAGLRPAGAARAAPRGAGAAFTGRRPALVVRAGYNNMVKLGGGKKWERQELYPSGKPVKIDMHVKKGDIVQVCVEDERGERVGHALRDGGGWLAAGRQAARRGSCGGGRGRSSSGSPFWQPPSLSAPTSPTRSQSDNPTPLSTANLRSSPARTRAPSARSRTC